MNNVIYLAVELIIFLIASYFIFYRSFLKELGKQNAHLATIEKLTKIQESVKADFNNQIEALKYELAKHNIEYQITLAELTKRRFENIETLVKALIELQDFMTFNLFSVTNDTEYADTKKEFNKLYKTADTTRKICNLYLSNVLVQNVVEVLNNSYNAYLSFLKMYRTNPQKFNHLQKGFSTTALIEKLDLQNREAYEKLQMQISKFPQLLDNLSLEIKSSLFLKNVD